MIGHKWRSDYHDPLHLATERRSVVRSLLNLGVQLGALTFSFEKRETEKPISRDASKGHSGASSGGHSDISGHYHALPRGAQHSFWDPFWDPFWVISKSFWAILRVLH